MHISWTATHTNEWNVKVHKFWRPFKINVKRSHAVVHNIPTASMVLLSISTKEDYKAILVMIWNSHKIILIFYYDEWIMINSCFISDTWKILSILISYRSNTNAKPCDYRMHHLNTKKEEGIEHVRNKRYIWYCMFIMRRYNNIQLSLFTILVELVRIMICMRPFFFFLHALSWWRERHAASLFTISYFLFRYQNQIVCIQIASDPIHNHLTKFEMHIQISGHWCTYL